MLTIPKPPSIPVGPVRLPADMVRDLQIAAKENDRSVAYIIRAAIAEYFNVRRAAKNNMTKK